MAIRELVDKHARTATIIAVLAVVAVTIYLVRSAMAPPLAMPSNGYYTTDDGQTVFVDDLAHLPPFDHDGKPASRVWMYSCDDGKTKFPGYLERFTSQAKIRIESETQDFNSGKTQIPPSKNFGDTEIKKPGSGNPWVSRTSPQAQKITNVQCPGGSGGSGGTPEVQLP